MTERSVLHNIFTLERTFNATPERVFNAFSDAESKKKWFSGPPEWKVLEASMDFREGGKEVNVGQLPSGEKSEFYATYLEIVPNERIIYTYEMNFDNKKLSHSLTTIELAPNGDATDFKMTEQGAYLDGHEDPQLRIQGTEFMLYLFEKSLV